MNREVPRDPGKPRRDMTIFDLVLVVVLMGLVIAVMLIAFTDVWPYMHEVLWQQSWKPVCDDGHGHLKYC